ncbi:hypothetical protein GCM10010451_68660 [Streptomyces virens]|uniref:Integral membrane protein n=1 Tax=Streptomyces virens TaxID=285572 RepID=A0ABP6HJ49_9ACTN
MAPDQQSGEGPREEWSILDVVLIGGALASPLIIAPAVLFALGDRLTATLVASASWVVLLFYESPLAANLKDEVSRRVG